MDIPTRYPSTVTVLKAAADIHAKSAELLGPQHATMWGAIAQAAAVLGAPARVEIAAANAVEAALGADAEYLVWATAIDEAIRRRLDLDRWLQDALWAHLSVVKGSSE